MSKVGSTTGQRVVEGCEERRARQSAGERAGAADGGQVVDAGDVGNMTNDVARSSRADRSCALAESMPHFVWEADPNGVLLYANRRFLDYLGQTLEQTRARGWLAAQHPEDVPRLEAAWQYASKNAVAYDLESRFREAASGEYRWFRIQGSPVRDGGGRILHWVGTGTDIDDAKRAEAHLALVASFPLNNPNAIVEADWEGKVSFVNPAAGKIFPDIEALGASHPYLAGWDRLVAACRDAMSELPAREVQVADRWYHQTFFYVPATRRIRIYGLDVTEQKQTEEALRRAKEQWERTFDTVPDLIAVLDHEHRIVRANRAMLQRLGTSLERCVGRVCYSCLHGADRPPKNCPHVLTLADGQEHTAEVHAPALGGDFLVSTTPLQDARGRRVGSVHVARDITERKIAEDRGRLLAEVNSQLLASDQPQQIVESLCRKVTDHLGCHVFFNYLVDEASGRLRLNAYAGVSDQTARQIQWLDYGGSVCGCVARDGQPIVAEQIQTGVDPRTELVRSFGIQAYACHPLLDQNQVIGTLSFGSRTKPRFAQDELDLMRTVADQVAIAMQRLRLLETLQRHARSAEAANAAKDQFLANVSHELRTPMAAILGMTDLALAADLPPTVREYLHTAKESADGLMQLLNEILDFSRMEVGKFQLELAPFDLRKTLERTLKALSVRAAEKGLNLICELPAELPDRLVGDPLRLRQVLTNLVGNAIKFTTRGHVAVQVTKLPSAAEGCRDDAAEVLLQFDVSDTGMGISPADQQRIFAPFTQVDPSMTRQFDGTGLGLAIASSLVSLMGGQIWVESQLGRGSTFHFTARFPTAAGSAEGAVVDESASSDALWGDNAQPTSRPVRVLLAEDTIANQRLVLAILGERGHWVQVANNGQEAIALLQQQDFDLVLMDVQMPLVDGLQTTAAIRALPDPVKANVAIVAITAHAMAGDQQRCLAAGMDAYLTKPLTSRKLIETVERLAIRAEGAPAAPRAATAEPPDGANVVFDLQTALASLGGRVDLLRDMAVFFFEETPRQLAEIRAGLQEHAPEAIGRAAHRLKGTLIYLGATPAWQAAHDVEQASIDGDLTQAALVFRVLTGQIAQLDAALRSWTKNGS
jgi:PAS domain S-box-containing protein